MTAKAKAQSVTVVLADPIQFGEELITELTLKRIKFKHLRTIPDLNNITTEQLGNLLERISGQPRAVIDEIDMEDFDAIGKQIAKILPAGLKTSQT